MSSRVHRVGIVGAGFQARNLAEAVARTSGLVISAITANGRASALTLASHLGVRTEPDSGALVQADDIDLVIVATPNHSHAELVAQALAGGKTVFVEKPLALDNAGLDAITALVADAPQRLIVGHTLRTAPGMRRMLASVDEDAIGTVISIEALRTRILTPPHTTPGWKHDPQESGGELIHEIHELDLACLVGGTVSSVASIAAQPRHGSQEPPVRHSLISFAGGAVAHHVIASGDHAARWSLTVSGTEASLHADLRAGTITRLEAGTATAQWPVFADQEINAALVAASAGRTSHNMPGAGASPWMAALAGHEMAEVARILNGAHDSILLRAPTAAVRVALAILDADGRADGVHSVDDH